MELLPRIAQIQVPALALLAVGCVSGRHSMSVSLGDWNDADAQIAAAPAEADSAVTPSTSGEADAPSSKPSDFHLVCWNVAKASNERFLSDLRGLVTDIPQHDKVILCLQEVRSTTYDQIKRLGEDKVSGHYAESWRYPLSKRSTGVMTVSNRPLPAAQAARLRSGHREFFLTSPKVCLRSELVVSGDQRLTVLNCHGLNFVTDSVFQKQLDQVFANLSEQGDAVIVCGDFNVWSPSRLALLESKVRDTGLSEVSVDGHGRPHAPAWLGALKPLVGFDAEIPLDRIYTRGIDILNCRSVDGYESSDHAPLVLRFAIQN